MRAFAMLGGLLATSSTSLVDAIDLFARRSGSNAPPTFVVATMLIRAAVGALWGAVVFGVADAHPFDRFASAISVLEGNPRGLRLFVLGFVVSLFVSRWMWRTTVAPGQSHS
jgi:hypothetical protein